MPSNYSTRLRIELQVTGENPNTWGDIANGRVFQLLEDAIAKYTRVNIGTSVSANVCVSVSSGAQDEQRAAFIEFIGQAASAVNIVVPDTQKGTWFKNSVSGSALAIKPNSGSSYSLPSGQWVYLINTSTVFEAPFDPSSFNIAISASTINATFISATNINVTQNLSVTNLYSTFVSATSIEATYISVTNLSVTNINAKNLIVQSTAEFQTNISVSGDAYASNYFMRYLDKGSLSGIVSIAVSAAGFQKVSVAGSSTMVVAQWPPATYAANVMLEIWNGGGSTITWSGISFITSTGVLQGSPASAGTSLQTSGVDFVLVWSRDAGTTKYAKVVR